MSNVSTFRIMVPVQNSSFGMDPQSTWWLHSSLPQGATKYATKTYDTNRHMLATPAESVDADASGSTTPAAREPLRPCQKAGHVLPHGARFDQSWHRLTSLHSFLRLASLCQTPLQWFSSVPLEDRSSPLSLSAEHPDLSRTIELG